MSTILIRLAIGAVVVLALYTAFLGFQKQQQGIGEARGAARVQKQWDDEKIRVQAQAIEEAHTRAKESQRRQERQEENQREQDRLVAAARAAAARNAADADRVQRDYDAAAAKWRARLADSPTAEDLAAAGAAIAVCTDVRGRLDSVSGQLAAYAGAARAAGLKCEADYDALSNRAAPAR